MDEQAITTLGGVCQILGVVAVVWDLLAKALYRGTPQRVIAWLRARKAIVMAVVRRLLGQPSPSVNAHAELAGVAGIAGSATGRLSLGPFAAQPDQTLEQQIAVLARLVNWLREEVLREQEDREQAITAERDARRKELRAEAERLERLIAEVRQELGGLREVTTGGARLHWQGVPVVLAGIAFTTWPAWWAERWPGWLTGRLLVLMFVYYVAGRLWWTIETELRQG